MKFLIIFLFFSYTQGITIECNFTTVSSIYTCKVKTLSISGNPAQVTSISGVHELAKSNFDVSGVDFVSICSQLTEFPKGLSKFFPDIVKIYINSCKFNLTGSELAEFPKLEDWSFNWSNLEFIPSNFLDFTPNLKFVSFHGDKIKKIDYGFLKKLKSLKSLKEGWFWGNPCVDKIARTPQQLSELFEIISNNCIGCQRDKIEDFNCLNWRLDELDARDNLLASELEVLKQRIAKLEAKP